MSRGRVELPGHGPVNARPRRSPASFIARHHLEPGQGQRQGHREGKGEAGEGGEGEGRRKK